MTLASLRARLAAIGDQSYYEILRLPSTSSRGEVKAAFHEFALACHPDQYVDEGPDASLAASELFKRGVEAYKVLTDPGLRARYGSRPRMPAAFFTRRAISSLGVLRICSPNAIFCATVICG